MTFPGFGPQALPFFKALAFPQTRNGSREPGKLTRRGPGADGRPRRGGGGSPRRSEDSVKGDRKSSVFRIHRDVRFSKNKDPYKTNAGVAMTRSGSKNDPGVLYFHLSPEECFFAAGFHQPEPEALRSSAARLPGRRRPSGK